MNEDTHLIFDYLPSSYETPDEQNYIESHFLETGDVILLSEGGHGFEILEETEMIEVKQGPYAGENDKTRFEPVSPNQMKLVKNE